MARTPRKEVQVDETRRAILRAAARAAARVGFDAVTLREIAKETGIAVGTLYRYFPGKEALQDALMLELKELILSPLRVPVPTGLDFRQKLELMIQRQLVGGEQWRESLSLVANPRAGLPLEATISADVVEAIAQWVKANATAKEIGGRDPVEIAFFYMAVMQSVYSAARMKNDEFPLLELLPRVTTLLFNGLALPVSGRRVQTTANVE